MTRSPSRDRSTIFRRLAHDLDEGWYVVDQGRYLLVLTPAHEAIARIFDRTAVNVIDPQRGQLREQIKLREPWLWEDGWAKRWSSRILYTLREQAR